MTYAVYLIPIVIAATIATAGFYVGKFTARNDQRAEIADLRLSVHDHQDRIYEVNRLRNDAEVELDELRRDYEQLDANHRATVAAYAQCEADLMLTDSRLRAAADELLAYGVDVRADWAEQEADTFDPNAAIGWDDDTDETPAWNDVTGIIQLKEWREESLTQQWQRDPSTRAVKAANDPNSPEYKAAQEAIDRLEADRERWNGFLPQLAAVPAQRDGGE